MGNAVMTPCFMHQSSSSTVKLIFWEGTSRFLKGKHIAGEIMFEFPDKMVCHAGSFFIGHPVPALAIDDELLPGQTYLVLPIDRFACNVLSASWLATLSSSSSSCNSPIKFVGKCPFEYLRGSNGRVLIKVKPEFIIRLINGGDKGVIGSGSDSCEVGSNGSLCSTPELKMHYKQLVKSKDQVWSPKLEAISEHKIRFSVSPCRFIGLQWKEKEKNVY